MKKELLKIFAAKFILSLIVALCLNGLASAQQPTPTVTPTPRDRVVTQPKQESAVEDGDVIKVDSQLVVVPASVTDNTGQPVMNLTADDFRLEEEGQRQQIAEIANAEQVPLEIVLLVDVSSSVNALFEYEKEAAARFLQNVMKPEDRASIVLVGNEPTIIQSRETAEKAAQTVRAIVPAKSFTAFFDSVQTAIDYLKKNSPKQSRRVILTLSDGEDTYSKSTIPNNEKAFKAVGGDLNNLTKEKLDILNRYRLQASEQNYTKLLRELQNADTVFYSINPTGSSVKLNKISMRAQNGLQQFADETGGTAFLPQVFPNVLNQPVQNAENERKNQESLDRIFRQIAAELRAQYLLQFYSEKNFETGKYVRLKVDLNNKPDLRVKARRGYFANSAQ